MNPKPHDVSPVTGIRLKISLNSPSNLSSLNFLSASSMEPSTGLFSGNFEAIFNDKLDLPSNIRAAIHKEEYLFREQSPN